VSDFHTALYSPTSVSKWDFLSALMQIDSLNFTGSIQGYQFCDSSQSLMPVLAQSYDFASNVLQALDISREWSSTCYYLCFLQWDIELFIINAPFGELYSVAIAFPHSLYKFCLNDGALLDKLVNFLLLVSDLQGNVALICGADVMPSYQTVSQLSGFMLCHLLKHHGSALYLALFDVSDGLYELITSNQPAVALWSVTQIGVQQLWVRTASFNTPSLV
jgi:hypothetical protein